MKHFIIWLLFFTFFTLLHQVAVEEMQKFKNSKRYEVLTAVSVKVIV
jgi:hypothetical protein